jgi:hypothetical protein
MRQQLAAGGHTSLPQVEDALDIPQVNKKKRQVVSSNGDLNKLTSLLLLVFVVPLFQSLVRFTRPNSQTTGKHFCHASKYRHMSITAVPHI